MDIQGIKNSILLWDKILNIKIFFNITLLILYTDCFLNVFYRKNIYNFNWSTFFVYGNTFQMIAYIFILYALFTFLFPLINIILYKIIIRICLNDDIYVEYDNKNYVYIYKVIEYAAIENNSILYEKCKNYKKENENRLILSNISFCIICLSFLNLTFENSIIQYLIATFSDNGKLKIEIFLFACFAWKHCTFNDDTERIYSPELAKLLNTRSGSGTAAEKALHRMK